MGRKPVDITGKRYGHLVAVRRTNEKSRNCYLWVVRCDCGKEKLLTAQFLNSGDVKSCGCQHYAPRSKKYYFRGEEVSVKQLCDLSGFSESWVRKSLRQGCSTEEIVKGISAHHKDYGFDKPTTIAELARIVGISRQAMWFRIMRGAKGNDILRKKGEHTCRKASANCVENS